MKETSEVIACVVDSGLYQPLAHCLATKMKRVLLWNPDMPAFPSVKQACIGDGFPDIERVDEFWPELKDIDLFVFPDCNQSGLQQHLIEIGKAVWGSRTGSVLELDREHFMEALESLGLDVPNYHVVVGWTALCEYLRDKQDKYIKISRFRGDMETTHWRSWEEDETWLHWLAVNFGSFRERMRFMVFDSIDTPLEIGGDIYCVDGRWPKTMLNGLESKDTTYISCVTPMEEMPHQITDIMEAFSPILKEHQYRNQWSMEVRLKGDKAYFIDATCRGGMPSSGSQQLVWKNFPEIIWAGAHGELVEPEPTAKFTLECMVTSKCGKDLWDEVVIDPDLLPWLRFSSCCFIDGKFCFPPDEFHEGELGWLVSIGDSPTEVLDEAKRLADMLPDGLDAKLENLVGLIKEVSEGEKKGVPFTEDHIPEPAEVVAD